MVKKDVADMINTDLEFIAIKRFDYSLTKFEERYPDGAPDHIIAAGLQIPEEDVEKLHQESVELLRAQLKVVAGE